MVFSIALSVPAMESMCMAPIWCNLPWSTETNAAWAQAFGLFITFGLQVGLLYLTLREQREARLERRAGEVARQRGDTTCAGVAINSPQLDSRRYVQESVGRKLPTRRVCL